MKLLILTQAVDLDDPVLGFFHRWIEALAVRAEQVQVVCLREGRHALPSNVTVHSLGKSAQGLGPRPISLGLRPALGWEKGRSRIKYVWNFYRYLFALRREYDAVFVHMNSEYAAMGGIFWRMLGKRLVLWRNHKLPGFSTWLGAHLAHKVCYTSPSAYVAKFHNAVQMPVGIDTDFFAPAQGAPAPTSILFLGRLDAVKKPDIFLEALQLLSSQRVSFRADVYGDPTPGREAYADGLKKKFADVAGLSFHPGVRNNDTPALYASHAVYCNLTPSGSFDKTILEAMACGTVVVCANDAVRSVVPEELMAGDSAQSTAQSLKAALGLSEAERRTLTTTQRSYIEREHSLALLVKQLTALIGA